MAKQSFDLPLLRQDASTAHRPRAVVLKIIQPDDPSETSPGLNPLDEICALADTAGVQVVGAVVQRRRKPHATTYAGKGKLEELDQELTRLEATLVLVDDPLSPRQGKSIEDRTSKRVIDRVELIMDIFAGNARTHQAKLQVELAQLKYSSTRLKRMWTHLSRFEGGIGMRGPGETQLETDRRIIRNKIDLLQERLEEIEQQRHTQHKGRADAFRVALVGYTNAGKSTLLRALTGADVLVEDRLFSTLDTSTRRWELPCPRDVLLSDTVGFIRKLPPGLVASFHATLMEAREADLLLHVVDGSTTHTEADIGAVEETLAQIDCAGHPTILLFNKIDRLPDERRIDLHYHLSRHPEAIVISAHAGTNLDVLAGRVLELVRAGEQTLDLHLAMAQAGLVAQLRKISTILTERYEEDGVHITVRCAGHERERLTRLMAIHGLTPTGAPSLGNGG